LGVDNIYINNSSVLQLGYNRDVVFLYDVTPETEIVNDRVGV